MRLTRTLSVAGSLAAALYLVGPAAADVPHGVSGTTAGAHVSSPVATHADRAAGHPPLRSVQVRWRQVASGLSAPTQVTSAPDGTRRLFVVQQGGSVKVVRHGHVRRAPYLSIARHVDPAGEGGLLSIAFSPTFRRDGLLWVTYAAASDGDLVVARMRAGSASASRVRSSTLRTVLRINHPTYDNHYGGQLAFGPDGRLYVGVGDGGSGGDPSNNAGDKSVLLGKVLRINPFGACRGGRYCVPGDNPFVGRPGRDEIWLMGLRNPWRFSFDRPTGDLWIGDVGQDAYEEIDRVPANPRRIHLGWSCKEGRSTYNASRCRSGVDYLGPVATVAHPMGESITGGFVYRGQAYRRELGGAYIFSDFITRRVWVYRPGPGKVLQDRRLGSGIGATSFGVDDRGEVLAVTYDGVLWRMRATRR